MRYDFIAIPDAEVPRAQEAQFQHVLDTYAGESNKVASVWRQFRDADLAFRPHPRSSRVEDIFRHQLLSERRFFGEFLGASEPPAAEVLPPQTTCDGYLRRFVELARPRLAFLAAQSAAAWMEEAQFFDVRRQRIWIFWRRVLHTAHHRTQLTVYLRLLGRPVVPTYGPTADVSWDGADPTTSVDAAQRR